MNVTTFRDKAREYGRAHRMLPWMIGDLLLEFVEAQGERAWQYVDEFGMSNDVLRDYMYIAERFPEDRRIDYELSIWYFREVSSLKSAWAENYLQEARIRGWSSKELRKVVKDFKAGDNAVRLLSVDQGLAISHREDCERKEEADAKARSEGLTESSEP